MKLNYVEQNNPEQTFDLYCRWIIEQEYETPERGKFLYCGKDTYGWYMIFYALRTLSLGGALLNKPEYTAAEPYLDRYCSEQLPNGALSSHFCGKPAAEMTVEEQDELIRTGKLNLADNGTNCRELVQAAVLTADPEKKKRYLDTVKTWQSRDRFSRCVQYLGRPLDSMVNGVMANAHEHYDHFAVQSTGFAGLTIAAAIRPGFVL